MRLPQDHGELAGLGVKVAAPIIWQILKTTVSENRLAPAMSTAKLRSPLVAS